ncbi:Cof-type HAD-IIB family hydrolase [Paenibacillus thalictri]|uniref:HAD family phosphatase n=1 Tax=Paenibacillus thalictri TaxID=2527873 RepID=A0A4Q9DS65_9BACL|nr:Cof-type HAD-IIB family hydrolase [Paenibacillus thalictri]TBL78236.1 HAD family phosphatase [Paenibacillus thalictri]
MGKLDGCLLITDMDGTMLNSGKTISEENKRAIHRFAQQGGRFTIATGRITSSAQKYVKELPINAPVILYNGAVIYDYAMERTVWEKTLPASVPNLLARLTGHFPGLGVEIYCDGKPYFVQENQITDLHRQIEGFYGKTVTDYHTLPQPWHKVLLAWEPALLDDVQKTVEAWVVEEDVTFVRSDGKYYEILPQDATKGHALDILLDHLDMKIEHCVAIGDQMNDLEMLTRAGVGVAVDNAVPELHRIANRRGKHHNEHAIADVVEWIESAWPKLS